MAGIQIGLVAESKEKILGKQVIPFPNRPRLCRLRLAVLPTPSSARLRGANNLEMESTTTNTAKIKIFSARSTQKGRARCN
jgi:hypothetical protein